MTAPKPIETREIEDAIRALQRDPPSTVCTAHADLTRAQVLNLRISENVLWKLDHPPEPPRRRFGLAPAADGDSEAQTSLGRFRGPAAIVIATGLVLIVFQLVGMRQRQMQTRTLALLMELAEAVHKAEVYGTGVVWRIMEGGGNK